MIFTSQPRDDVDNGGEDPCNDAHRSGDGVAGGCDRGPAACGNVAACVTDASQHAPRGAAAARANAAETLFGGRGRLAHGEKGKDPDRGGDLRGKGPQIRSQCGPGLSVHPLRPFDVAIRMSSRALHSTCSHYFPRTAPSCGTGSVDFHCCRAAARLSSVMVMRDVVCLTTWGTGDGGYCEWIHRAVDHWMDLWHGHGIQG